MKNLTRAQVNEAEVCRFELKHMASDAEYRLGVELAAPVVAHLLSAYEELGKLLAGKQSEKEVVA